MVLLIDANIILDVLMNRGEFVGPASIIWKLCETEQMKGYISALTFANIMYVLRKKLTADMIEEVYKKLKLIFLFADLTQSDLEKAVKMKWEDFEDAMQSAIAEHIHADYIITRNVCDFSRSHVPAYTPTEFLANMWKQH